MNWKDIKEMFCDLSIMVVMWGFFSGISILGFMGFIKVLEMLGWA